MKSCFCVKCSNDHLIILTANACVVHDTICKATSKYTHQNYNSLLLYPYVHIITVSVLWVVDFKISYVAIT